MKPHEAVGIRAHELDHLVPVMSRSRSNIGATIRAPIASATSNPAVRPIARPGVTGITSNAISDDQREIGQETELLGDADIARSCGERDADPNESASEQRRQDTWDTMSGPRTTTAAAPGCANSRMQERKTAYAVYLYGQLLGLTLTHAIYGLTIRTLILRNYYVWIPNDLAKAAALDGAGILQTFFRVFVPISIPGFVVCGIFQFTNQWNDFLPALVVVPSPSSQPVTVALNNLSGSTSVDWKIVMAGAVLAAIPTVIAYVVAGRYFIRGLTAAPTARLATPPL